jgi:hypothetical protein
MQYRKWEVKVFKTKKDPVKEFDSPACSNFREAKFDSSEVGPV